MAVNEKPFSEVNWGGQHPEGSTTGWNQSLAGSGKHGTRSFAQHRASARIARQAPQSQQMRAEPVPLQGDRVQSFVQGFAHAEADGAPRVLGAVAGALIGTAVYRSLENRRSR